MAFGCWYRERLIYTGEYTSEQFFVASIAVILPAHTRADGLLPLRHLEVVSGDSCGQSVSCR